MITDKYLEKLNKDYDDLLLSLESLNASYKKCKKIDLKKKFTFEEQESFDSLSSKFARTTDIYTQKILKTIFLILRENPKSFIDKANLAEKLEIIPSADELISVRDLRNEIVHEYVLTELQRIYEGIFLNYTNFISAIDKTNLFVKVRGWVGKSMLNKKSQD